jgi:hypothetical protein
MASSDQPMGLRLTLLVVLSVCGSALSPFRNVCCFGGSTDQRYRLDDGPGHCGGCQVCRSAAHRWYDPPIAPPLQFDPLTLSVSVCESRAVQPVALPARGSATLRPLLSTPFSAQTFSSTKTLTRARSVAFGSVRTRSAFARSHPTPLNRCLLPLSLSLSLSLIRSIWVSARTALTKANRSSSTASKRLRNSLYVQTHRCASAAAHHHQRNPTASNDDTHIICQSTECLK